MRVALAVLCLAATVLGSQHGDHETTPSVLSPVSPPDFVLEGPRGVTMKPHVHAPTGEPQSSDSEDLDVSGENSHSGEDGQHVENSHQPRGGHRGRPSHGRPRHGGGGKPSRSGGHRGHMHGKSSSHSHGRDGRMRGSGRMDTRRAEILRKCENVTCEKLNENCTNAVHFNDECCPRCSLPDLEEVCADVTCEDDEQCSVRGGVAVCCTKMPDHPLEILRSQHHSERENETDHHHGEEMGSEGQQEIPSTRSRRSSYDSMGGGHSDMGQWSRYQGSGRSAMGRQRGPGGYRKAGRKTYSLRRGYRGRQRHGGYQQGRYQQDGYGSYRGRQQQDGHDSYQQGGYHWGEYDRYQRDGNQGDEHDHYQQGERKRSYPQGGNQGDGHGSYRRGERRRGGYDSYQRGRRERGGYDSYPRGGRGGYDSYPRGGRGRGEYDSYPRGGRGGYDSYPRGGQGGYDSYSRGGRGRGQYDSYPRGGRGGYDSYPQGGRRRDRPGDNQQATCPASRCHEGETCHIRLGVAICCGHGDKKSATVLGYCRLPSSPAYATPLKQQGCHCTTKRRRVAIGRTDSGQGMQSRSSRGEGEQQGDRPMQRNGTEGNITTETRSHFGNSSDDSSRVSLQTLYRHMQALLRLHGHLLQSHSRRQGGMDRRQGGMDRRQGGMGRRQGGMDRRQGGMGRRHSRHASGGDQEHDDGHQQHMGGQQGRMGGQRQRMGGYRRRMDDHQGHMGGQQRRMGGYQRRMDEHQGHMGGRQQRMGQQDAYKMVITQECICPKTVPLHMQKCHAADAP